MSNTNFEITNTTKPAGQPDGYDYYIPIDTEESRKLEKADYKVRMAVMNIATVIANSVDFSSAIFEKYYSRLVECEKEYDRLKTNISNSIVIPFINSVHGENCNVSVKWTHTFKTPFVDVKYLYNIPDHSIEKDFAIGTFPAAEVGIADEVISRLETLASTTNADKDIFNYLVSNYPDPDERQQLKIDEFISKRDDREFEYESLKNTVTDLVNKFLEDHNVTDVAASLQWNLDFTAKTVSITKNA